MLGLATPASFYALHYPFSDVHRVRPDGTIRWRQRNLFISSTLAGELVGLNTLDNRYVQVAFANILLGILDTFRPEFGLIRPKQDRRKRQTRVSAMSPV